MFCRPQRSHDWMDVMNVAGRQSPSLWNHFDRESSHSHQSSVHGSIGQGVKAYVYVSTKPCVWERNPLALMLNLLRYLSVFLVHLVDVKV